MHSGEGIARDTKTVTRMTAKPQLLIRFSNTMDILARDRILEMCDNYRMRKYSVFF